MVPIQTDLCILGYGSIKLQQIDKLLSMCLYVCVCVCMCSGSFGVS